MVNEIKVYDLLEVEEILKITRRTLYSYIKDGKIKAVKVGRVWRIRHEDLDAFLTGKNQSK